MVTLGDVIEGFSAAIRLPSWTIVYKFEVKRGGCGSVSGSAISAVVIVPTVVPARSMVDSEERLYNRTGISLFVFRQSVSGQKIWCLLMKEFFGLKITSPYPSFPFTDAVIIISLDLGICTSVERLMDTVSCDISTSGYFANGSGNFRVNREKGPNFPISPCLRDSFAESPA